MKKISVLSLILGIAIILVGCEGGGTGDAPAKSPYIGGNQGVVATFEPMGIIEDGINTVWTGETFPVHVTVKNKGEVDIVASDTTTKHLTVTLKGVDTSLFAITTAESTRDNTAALEGLSEFNKLGGETTLQFKDNAVVAALTTPYYDADFYANVDYDYTTYAAVPKVCFKQDLRDETICDISGSKTVYSSGAPIKVTSVREDPAGSDTLALTFDIENVGGGRVTKVGEIFNPRYDKVGFSLSEAVPPASPVAGTIYWTCTSAGKTGEARLVDGKTQIRCKSTTLPADTLYTKQVILTLDYKYRTVIQQSLRVKKN